jgi:methanol--5-hydroxybenzimidazolylcobamide Co-methyltransferase
MNEGTAKGKDTALLLRDLHADSDSRLDPQAYVLRPDVVLDISKELVKTDGYYARTVKAAQLAIKAMREGSESGHLILADREKTWLDDLSEQVDELPKDAQSLTAIMVDMCDKLDTKKYDM